MLINSSQNSTYKRLHALTKKKYRMREGLVLFEGKRLVKHLLANDIAIEMLVLEESTDSAEINTANQPVVWLNRALFQNISDTVHSQGVIAVVATSALTHRATSPHLVVCDGIQDPGNLGAIIRTCDALGFDNILLTKGCVDVYSQKVLRATMGSILNVTITTALDNHTLTQTFKDGNYQIVATALTDSVPISQLRSSPNMAIVFGNEGNGVSNDILSQAHSRIYIPMQGSAESLNVATSAAIVLYHIMNL